jgi:hypothetical protein
LLIIIGIFEAKLKGKNGAYQNEEYFYAEIR